MKSAKHRSVGHPVTPIIGVGIGAAICLILTILMSAITAWLVSGEQFPQNAIDSAAVPITLIATFIGCIAAILITGNMPAVIAGGCAGCYFVILLFVNILFMDSSLGGVGKGFAGILGGAALAVIINVFVRNPKKRMKHRNHR